MFESAVFLQFFLSGSWNYIWNSIWNTSHFVLTLFLECYATCLRVVWSSCRQRTSCVIFNSWCDIILRRDNETLVRFCLPSIAACPPSHLAHHPSLPTISACPHISVRVCDIAVWTQRFICQLVGYVSETVSVSRRVPTLLSQIVANGKGQSQGQGHFHWQGKAQWQGQAQGQG